MQSKKFQSQRIWKYERPRSFLFQIRQWIGIDQSDEAIKSTTEKLNNIKGDLFVSQTDFQLWTEKKHSPQQHLAAMAGDEQ